MNPNRQAQPRAQHHVQPNANASVGVILVTGGTGFVGKKLVYALSSRNHDVRILTRVSATNGVLAGNTEFIIGDVRDRGVVSKAVRGVHTIYHLASVVHDTSGRVDEQEHHSVTVDGTNVLLEAAARADVRAIVYMSSLAVYGGFTAVVRDESASCAPAGAYGRGKLAAEQSILEWGRRTTSHVCCLRPASIYGAGCKGNLPRMLKMIDRGLFPPPPRLTGRRSFVHVDDVVRTAILASIHPLANGRCFNLTDGNAISARTIYEAMCDGFERRPSRLAIPRWLFTAGGHAGDLASRLGLKGIPFDSNVFRTLFEPAEFDSARIARELGFMPTRSLVNSIPEMIASVSTRRNASVTANH